MAETNDLLKSEIAQRILTETALRESTQRLDAILAGTRSIVWTTDSNGLFSTPQKSWERFTGQTWEEHQGMGWVNAIHEEDRASIRRRWNESVTSGSKHQVSGRIWNQNTHTFHTFVAEAVPVRNADGSIREWVGTVSDIEEQHQAEANLGIAQSEIAKQKRELELIYEAAPVGMSLIDREFRFLRINDTLATINGYSREQHIGRRADELLSGLNDQLVPIYNRVFETSAPVLNVEIVGKTPATDEPRTWLASYFPLKLENAKDSPVTAVSAIVQDITERKRQEERLRTSEQMALAANRSKSEFLANMSHEIRTPMAAILGYSDVLLGQLTDTENRNCVLIMKRNGEHLLELINDILDLSRIEAGKLDVEIEPIPLPQLVADIQSLMAVRADEKKVKFDIAFEGKVPRTIETDAKRLRQVLINLIGNAIKFTDEGQVLLKVKFIEGANPPMIEFAIQDSGIGMTDEQIERLFKPFSQADSSVTRQYGGSGLGLAISQRLVQMMNGEMDLESRLGKGSTFYVRLPVASFDSIELVNPSLTLRELEPEVELAQTPTLACRVLIVDDRRDVRHISQHFLQKAGAKVVTADDGQKGINAAQAAVDTGQAFDLILMDMQMPKIDGLQATAILRSVGIDWPIIALTADAMKGDRDRCLNGGCDDYLSKPIDHRKLVSMVAKYTQVITRQELLRLRAERAQLLRAKLDENS